jgi:acetyltransferase-like isoleucine patch superfamily enzyme
VITEILQRIASLFRRERPPKFLRGQKRFHKRYPENQYPNYFYGVGTYGTPIVHEFANATRLVIGSYSSIADDVHIFLGGNHRIDWISTYPFPTKIPEAAGIPDYETSRGDVIIGNDVWLGSGCTILSGITVGDGAVVGARSVVTRNVPPYAIVAGNPARLVRWRFDEATRQALSASCWWSWPENEVRQLSRLLSSSQVDEFLAYCSARPRSD